LAIISDDNLCPGYPKYITQSLYRLRTLKLVPDSVDVWISHKPPPSYPKFPYKGIQYYEKRPPYVVGRSMIESSVLPQKWKKDFERVDEVWVPSKFLVQVFLDAGVNEKILHHIPESIDTHFYNPDQTTPLELPGKKDFNFLSIFKWEERKGWDILLDAYFHEFSNQEDVCLYIQTYAFKSTKSLEKVVQKFVSQKTDLVKKKLPCFKLLTETLERSEMPKLYKAADTFVLPSRGEGKVFFFFFLFFFFHFFFFFIIFIFDS